MKYIIYYNSSYVNSINLVVGLGYKKIYIQISCKIKNIIFSIKTTEKINTRSKKNVRYCSKYASKYIIINNKS